MRAELPYDYKSNAVPIAAANLCYIYALTVLMYIAAGPDSNTRGGGELPDPNECNSTPTNATREETLTPNPKKCSSALTSGTSGGEAPT